MEGRVIRVRLVRKEGRIDGVGGDEGFGLGSWVWTEGKSLGCKVYLRFFFLMDIGG